MGVLSRALVASSLLFSLAAAIPTPDTGLLARDDKAPCAQVAAKQEKQMSEDPKGEPDPK